jgi:hypothetical protein
MYGAALLAIGLGQAPKIGWRAAMLFPVAASIMHAAYAAGFVWGLVRDPYRQVHTSSNKGACHASGT